MKGFKKGYTPWNKGLKGYYAGQKNSNWKGGRPKCIVCDRKLTVYTAKRCVQHENETRKGHSVSEFTIQRMKKLTKARIGTKQSEEQKMRKAIKLANFYKNKIPTSIEKIVYTYLDSKGIVFEKQKLINNKFNVDIYISSLNLIIECDGKYWRSLSETIKKDKAENAYLTKCGFNLTRLKEEDILNGSYERSLLK